jgi:hypothetical protein
MLLLITLQQILCINQVLLWFPGVITAVIILPSD